MWPVNIMPFGPAAKVSCVKPGRPLRNPPASAQKSWHVVNDFPCISRSLNFEGAQREVCEDEPQRGVVSLRNGLKQTGSKQDSVGTRREWQGRRTLNWETAPPRESAVDNLNTIATLLVHIQKPLLPDLPAPSILTAVNYFSDRDKLDNEFIGTSLPPERGLALSIARTVAYWKTRLNTNQGTETPSFLKRSRILSGCN